MYCNYPMHDMYIDMLCPACQCRKARVQRNLKAAKPTIDLLAAIGFIALVIVLGRWIDG